MESRNSADYMELERIVKARRRQTFIRISFCDVKTRPYFLRANCFIQAIDGSHYLIDLRNTIVCIAGCFSENAGLYKFLDVLISGLEGNIQFG